MEFKNKRDFSRTKVVATVGPACQDREVLKAMINAGMNVARVNCSHGEPEDFKRTINHVNSCAEELGIYLPILADLGGPKIRLGDLKEEVPVKTGDQVTLCCDPQDKSPEKLPAGYPGLAQDLSVGKCILIDDGLLQLEVEAITGADITCRVLNNGVIKSRKGINLPGVTVSLSCLTEKDRRDLDFLVTQKIDYVALSFVRSAQDIHELRALMNERNVNFPIIAKIEKPEAVENIESIIEATDMIMVARGDLGVEMLTEKVPVAQKRIISFANRRNKPVITATQMLDSMINNPRPTRAEASDVANAVFDGTDAVMLSGETSVGAYPVETVRMMKKIVMNAEDNRNWRKIQQLRDEGNVHTPEALICHSACVLAEEAEASYIITLTLSGRTPRLLSQYRSPVPILAFTESEKTMRYLAIIWGVKARKIDKVGETDETLNRAGKLAFEKGYVQKGDRVVYTTGIPLLKALTTNMLKLDTI